MRARQTAGERWRLCNALNATDVRTELGSRFDAPTLIYAKPLVLCGCVAWAQLYLTPQWTLIAKLDGG
jgi:hypothetical protein